MKPKAKDRGGRPRKTPIKAGEKVQLGVRVSPARRAQLDKAARQSGRSLTQEAEARIERSFDRQELLPEALTLAYGPQLAGLLMVIGRAMSDAGSYAGFLSDSSVAQTKQWLENPYGYREAENALSLVMECFRPSADVVVPKVAQQIMDKTGMKTWGAGFATGVLSSIAGRSATLTYKQFADTVRPLLGRLAEIDKTEKETSE